MTMMVILLPCRSLLLLSLTVCNLSPFIVNHLFLASSLFCKLSVVDVRDDLQPDIFLHAPPTHLNKLILQKPSRSFVVAEWESRRVMSTANFSADEKQITSCWSGLTAAPGIHGHLIFISVLNVFLSITAVLGNALIIVGLHKEASLHPPSKLLLRCLATTDLCAGLISEPINVAYTMSELNGHWNICRFLSAAEYLTSLILCGVSLLTVTAISVDRLALLLLLRYRQVVTLKRTYMIVITFWIVSAVFSTSYFWNSLVTECYITVNTSLCLISAIISYTKIFFTLRHHQAQFQDQAQQPNQTSALNIARYKKAVSSALWLQMTLVACHLPHCTVVALWTNSEVSLSVFLARKYTMILVFLNSSLNPILYCWKIEEVRQAVKDTIRQVLCYSSC